MHYNIEKFFKSQMAFRGFRGFDHDTPLIDLKDMTLFTGKNGSGKSTFVKLLQMMCGAMKNVHSIKDLMNLEINIGTDILGGADHLLFDPEEINPRWVFTTKFAFYQGEYEVHIIFQAKHKNKLTIKSIELNDEHVDDKKDPSAALVIWKGNEMKVNWKELNDIYIKHAKISNAMEGLRYYFHKLTEGEQPFYARRGFNLDKQEMEHFENVLKFLESDFSVYETKIEPEDNKVSVSEDEEELWDDQYLERIIKLFDVFSYNSSRLYLKDDSSQTINKPFHIRDRISEKNEYGIGNEYSFVFSSESDFEIGKKDIRKFVQNLPLSDRKGINNFIEGQEILEKDYDFAGMMVEKINWLFKTKYISANAFDTIESLKLHSSHFYINGPEIRQKLMEEEPIENWVAGGRYENYEEYINEETDSELADFYDLYEDESDFEFMTYHPATQSCVEEVCNLIIRELIKPKYEYYKTLISQTRHAFENNILDHLKAISAIAFQSSVIYGVERTYNIYQGNNQYSTLLNFLDNQDKVQRKEILNSLNAYLSILDIEKEFIYDIKENAGFIYLDNNGHRVNLIDEGSGISKVIGLLFFILENIFKNRENIESERLLILEEPESNLHPSIQSKLADLFLDVLSHHNVRLLIETHSEYLIRKLQYLVATGHANRENIGINYFSMSNAENEKRKINFYEIPIGADGRLEREFGAGFFDEANNLSVELFLLNKNQDN